MKTPDSYAALFDSFRDNILSIDPLYFCEKYLTLNGKPFKVNDNGYKPFADIYKYIAVKAIDKDAKPIVLVKGRQVGATTMAAALECYFAACGLYGTSQRAPMRMMHLFPTLALAAAYTKDKLDPMIGSSIAIPGQMKSNGLLKSYLESKLDSSNPANNNQHFKKFQNGNQVWIESTGLDGDRIRGRSVDAIFYDEVQDMSDLAIGAAGKVASIAQHGRTGEGVRVFFGTPKTKGGSYWNMWQASSQNYFHLNCEKCGEFFPLYHPTVNWEDVWIYGKTVKCTHCNHEQDKVEATERGKWIPMNDPEKSEYVGYHFNQLYIPTFDKETIVRAKPDKSPVNTERVYMNEVLGEFYDGQGGTISIEDIHTKCADKGRKMASHLLPNENRKVYAGFDWGQKGALEQFLGGRAQGRSYSCAVILTADGPNILNVEFATRLMRNDPEAKQEVVEEMFRKYSVSLAVGDIGDAFDLTHRMQRMYGDAFLASRSSHRITGHIKFADDEFPKVIHFEKDYYISEILGRLKNGHIRFPYGSYDKIDWLISHCASMDIKVTKDKSGEAIKRYVKGSGPNDGLMALLNAYIAWKFDITSGFKIKQPNEMRYDVAKHARQIDAVVGYIPRLFGGGRI